MFLPSPGQPTVRVIKRVLTVLIGAGVPLHAAAHAFAILKAFVYSFVLQEESPRRRPWGSADGLRAGMNFMLALHWAEFTDSHVAAQGCFFARFFTVELNVVLDGIAKMRPTHAGNRIRLVKS